MGHVFIDNKEDAMAGMASAGTDHIRKERIAFFKTALCKKDRKAVGDLKGGTDRQKVF